MGPRFMTTHFQHDRYLLNHIVDLGISFMSKHIAQRTLPEKYPAVDDIQYALPVIHHQSS
jgi:hypothetical protein